MYRCWCCPSVVFFFKQKTAYEMRMSDWSSDVCSSDLLTCNRGGGKAPAAWRPRRFLPLTLSGFFASLPPFHLPPGSARGAHLPRFPLMPSAASLDQLQTLSENLKGNWNYPTQMIFGPGRLRRSEEHTSELQSLMRISYAVFCLQKKKNES